MWISVGITSLSLLSLILASSSNAQDLKPLCIPLEKKLFLKSVNGVFNMSANELLHHRTVKKYNRSFDKFAHNEKLKDQSPVKSNKLSRKRVRHLERLTNQGNQMWTGLLEIGTPGQTLSVDFDTGSSDFWIPSVNCQAQSCDSKNSYNESASRTSSKLPDLFNITYGDGSFASGIQYRDSVKLAGLTITNQTFSSASLLSDSFQQHPSDGVLGLAYPAISKLQTPSIVENAFDQGLIASKIFSFKLSNDGGELSLGGVSPTCVVDELDIHPVVQKKYWQIGNGSVFIGEKNIRNDCQMIIDSGSTIIYGPKREVQKIYDSISGATEYQAKEGLWQFPCTSAPLVSFSWDSGKKWEIDPQKMSLGKTGNDSSQCVGAIASQSFFSGDVWVMGDVFMSNVCSVFNPTENTVSFAKLS